MLAHPSRSGQTSQNYPGVVLGSFAGSGNGDALGFGEDSMRLGGDMEGIMDMDMSAQRGAARHGSEAGVNIAPWLMDDSAKSGPPPPTPAGSGQNTPSASRKHSTSLGHSTSHPSLPRMKRTGTGATTLGDLGEYDGLAPSTTSSSRSGSHPDIFPVPHPPEPSAMSREPSRMRDASSESVHTLGALPGRRGHMHHSELFVPPGGGRAASVSAAKQRMNSTASGMSSGSERKKGFLGGFLKRKGTAICECAPWRS
jgi:adenylate cyclase